MKVADLRPADYNPRDIREAALEGLKASVDEFGMPQGIVWNKRTRNMVGGHQRAKTLDPNAETDVVVVDLDEKKEKALNLALNNPHIQGEWTGELAKIIDELETADPEMLARLALDELRVDVPDFGDEAAAPESFPEVTDQTVATQHSCPKCGYQF